MLVVLGSAFGATTGVLFASDPAPEEAPRRDAGALRSSSSSTRVFQLDASGPLNRQQAEIESLRKRVDELANVSKASDPPESQIPPRDPLLAEAEWQAEWDERVEEFDDERVDPSWAGSAERDLNDRLSTLANASAAPFRVDDVACRTRRCRAELSWDAPGTAKQGIAEIAHADYPSGCAIAISVDKDEDGALLNTATTVLDCSEGA